MIAEKEFTLIRAISAEGTDTQRELSSKTGLSLGMTNILLKRLISKGYLKVKQLDWNKTEYLLTLKGSMEKARKSYSYALFVWDQAFKIKAAIQERVIREYRSGLRDAIVVAWPETVDLIKRALAEKDLPGLEIAYVDAFKYVPKNSKTIFIATIEKSPKPAKGQQFIPLLDEVDLQFEFSDEG